uniref:Uncharacterized protein n=1 Tax=Oryza brachyantha TaxID=4533 RepID=J3LPE7_ORYBR
KGIVEGNLSPLTANPPGQLNVLWHDGHALGVNGAQVGVLEETNKVCLRSFLEGKDCMALETQISSNLEVLGDFPNKPLEGQLPDQKLSALLVLANFTGNSSRAVTVGLLNSSSGGSRLTCSLCVYAASWVPFLLWIYEQSAWYGP